MYLKWAKSETDIMNHKSVDEPADRKSNMPLSRLPRKIREGKEEGESDEGDRRTQKGGDERFPRK